ncbi:hypothetical protein LCGC14_0371450 [marine sediment metagenome]|uniref:Uncharacterized protein n=1 Tax=marine sediment metagenome TaxID=412755 RepID=A0A0F9WDK4_9ZZZZ
MTLNYGNVYIEYGETAGNGEMRLACREEPKVDIKEDAGKNIFHMPGDRRAEVHGIETIIRKVIIREALFKTEADWLLCQKNLRKLNKAGTMTLQWAKNSTPTFIYFWSDGTTDYNEMEVKYITCKGGTRVSHGTQEKFMIDQIQFEQAG